MKNKTVISLTVVSLWLLSVMIFVGKVYAENIAPLGEATASSVWRDCVGSKVNDGSEQYPANTWVSAENTLPPHWVRIIWPKPYKISEVSILNGPYGGMQSVDFQIQTLKSKGDPEKNEDWETQMKVTDNASQKTTHELNDVITQGIRLYITKPTNSSGGDNDMARIVEMKVEGISDLTPSDKAKIKKEDAAILEKPKAEKAETVEAGNIAPLGEASASSVWRDCVGSKVNDGSEQYPANTWVSAENTLPPHWVRIIWPKPYKISGVSILNCPYGGMQSVDFQIQTLKSKGDPEKNEDWETQVKVTDNASQKTTHELNDVITQGIRLYITKPAMMSDGDYDIARIIEMTVEGTSDLTPAEKGKPKKGAAAILEKPKEELEWTGKGEYRLIVGVVPNKIEGKRKSDEMPAKVQIDFSKLFSMTTPPDLSSIQVIRYDSDGKPIPYTKYSEGQSQWDLPFRFDFSDADPKRHSFMYNLKGNSTTGNLVWTHTQEEDKPSYYGIYFNPLLPGQRGGSAPKPQIGDCDTLFRKEGSNLASLVFSRPVVVDWRGNGKKDLLIANILGYILVYPDITPEVRAFSEAEILTLADGKPLFVGVGMAPAPLPVDWDGDGDLDLIVGAEMGRVLYYENTAGPGEAPKFVDRGRVCTKDGKQIEPPAEPCPETPFIKKDYCPYPEVVDWDGDGDLDLLLGGYLTGQTFYYENTSSNKKGLPQLEFRGAVQADGKVIDVSWIASPTVADFDDDGDLDMVVGSFKVNKVGGSDDSAKIFLHYFENIGTRTAPQLKEKPFPLKGNWSDIGNINFPRVVDWDGDDDLDIILGTGWVSAIKILRNAGDKKNVLFQPESPFTMQWGPYIVNNLEAVDFDGDGSVELVADGILKNKSSKIPPVFERMGSRFSAGGQAIYHKSKTGDDWASELLFDFDKDGDLDLIMGEAGGYVWYYENTVGPGSTSFAAGKKFQLANGKDLKVGVEGTEVTDIATHTGDRSFPGCGDFDSDGDNDLMVSDAYGKVTYFENLGTDKEPKFAEGKVILEGEGRAMLYVVDWDQDGLLDLIVSWTGGLINFCRNTGTDKEPKFSSESKVNINLPVWIPYAQPFVCDWNGDGDSDLMATSSYSFLYFAEHSFLNHEYAKAQVVDFGRKK